MNINLTKKSKKQLREQNNGTGILFINEDGNKTWIIKFYLAKNKKFYLINNCIPPIELYKYLDEIIPELMCCIKSENYYRR